MTRISGTFIRLPGSVHLSLLLLIFLLPAMLAACGSQERTGQAVAGNRDQKRPVVQSPPPRGIYLGAYIDFGVTEDDVTLEAIMGFEELVGKHQAIIASSSYWGEQSFPRKNAELITRHGSVPLIFWSPWDRPYTEGRKPDRFQLENILSGKWDSYIDRWADEARDFGGPLLVAWGLEMNGNWFPWSGCFYGGGKLVAKGEPSRFAGPELYKKAYRYVVDRVRTRGASRIQWVFHVNNASWPQQPWNTIAQYYPGVGYVDWLGMSAYGKQFLEGDWTSFETAISDCYKDLCELDPEKPVMVAEWGVGEFPGIGNKAQWIKEGLTLMKTRLTRIKAAVYWHERWQNADESYSNLRINSSPEALAAYRQEIAEPEWLEYFPSPLAKADGRRE